MLLVLVGTAPSHAQGVPITFWYAHGGSVGQAIQALCQDFNARHPQLRALACIAQGTYEQTLQKTVAAYRSHQAPALVELYDVATQDLLYSGAIRPVADLLPDTDDLLPAARRYYSNNAGRLLAQPFSISTAVLYSRRSALAQAGLDQPPATWEAFDSALRQLRAHGQRCPAASDFNPWIWLEQSSAVQGVAVASEDNGWASLAARYRFAQGPQTRLFADLVAWRQAGLLLDQRLTRSGQQDLAFASGECALLLASTGSWPNLAAQADDIQVSPLPVFAGRVRRPAVVGGSALWVLRGQPAEAYTTITAFLAYLREPGVQANFSARTGFLPLSATQAKGLQGGDQPAQAAGLAALGGQDQLAIPLRVGFITQLRRFWLEELEAASAGQRSPAAALQRAARRGDAQLALFQETYRHAVQP